MNQTTPSVEAINVAFAKFTDSLSPELKQRMNGRLERGLEIALSRWITPYDPSTMIQFKVKSSDPTKLPYMIDMRVRTCSCPDHAKGHFCKHRVAAHVYKLACALTSPQETPHSEPVESQPENNGQTIIWACVRQNGSAIGVEVVGIDNDLIWVQALPIVKDDGKLEPQFPFPDGKCSKRVQATDLEHIRIFQNE